MPSLPPFTADVSDGNSAWDAILARVAEGRRIDPVDGCFEKPWLEIGTVAGLASFFAAIALWLAALVTVFITPGPVLGAVAGAAIAATVATKVFSAREVARLRRQRREGRIVPGAWAYVDDPLRVPGDGSGVAIVVVDLGAAPDRAAVLGAARRLGGAFREHWPHLDDPSLADAKALLNSRTWGRVRLGAPYTDRSDMWLARVNVPRGDLPRKAIDRNLYPMIAHPTQTEDSVSFLPPRFWWREDVESLLGD